MGKPWALTATLRRTRDFIGLPKVAWLCHNRPMPSVSPSAAFWSDQDIAVLEDFLLRDDAPENSMDASMIDGFLTAILSGPRLIMPGEALRWIWDTENGKDGAHFKDEQEAQKILGLVMQQWNAIAQVLMQDPQAYEPLILERTLDEGRVIPIIDEWCMGYQKGMALDKDGWAELSIAQPDLLKPVWLYGSEGGWEILQKYPLSDEEHEQMADSLGDMARQAHAWFLQRRDPSSLKTPATSPVRREGPKLGRNDPCHCGSGRKYKQCHGAN